MQYSNQCLRLLSFVWLVALVAADRASPSVLAQRYSLTTSTAFPFPTATQSNTDTQNLLVGQWSLGKGRIQDGADKLSFVDDPYPNNTVRGTEGNNSGPVLQATYPAGSFSHETGGAQFYNLWNTSDGSPFQSMMVSYEVAFQDDFDWVKGGKLPGLRGGLNSTGCSGGNEADGRDCFTARLMWRRNGQGEAYLYIPRSNKICDDRSFQCNDEFGISISRGSFILTSAQWHRVTMVAQLNNPTNVANGNFLVYFDDDEVIRQEKLQFRTADTLNINGFFFSTFFGGSDSSWATPTTTHTYYRNITMWGGGRPSNLTGQVVNGAHRQALSTMIPTMASGIVTILLSVIYTLF